MSPPNIISGLVVVLFALTSNCGTGGIVDNGNQPPTEPTAPGQDSPPPAFVARLDVLEHYSVAAPDGTWSAVSDSTKTTITNGKKSVTFSFVAKPCDASPVANAYGAKRYTCSGSQSVFGVVDGHFIAASYFVLDADIEIILNSFTAK